MWVPLAGQVAGPFVRLFDVARTLEASSLSNCSVLPQPFWDQLDSAGTRAVAAMLDELSDETHLTLTGGGKDTVLVELTEAARRRYSRIVRAHARPGEGRLVYVKGLLQKRGSPVTVGGIRALVGVRPPHAGILAYKYEVTGAEGA